MMSTFTTALGTVTRTRAEAVLEVVDSHTCGQPTRVVISGAPFTPGMGPADARALMRDQFDWMRRMVIFEPRGHRSMFGAALIPPAADGGSYGVVFMDAKTYPDMCGHATIGTATTLIELGLIRPDTDNGSFEFKLHTPAGTLKLRATIVDGHCNAVAFRSPLAYYVGDATVEIDGSEAVVEVAYGGQYYGFVPAALAGLEIEPNSIDALIAAARPLRQALDATHTLVDPRTGERPEVGNIVWTADPTKPQANALNVPVSSSDSFDRSPCGTATCARMATLVAKGQLAIDETFVNQSIMGTLYVGRAVSNAPEGDFGGIVPEVEGQAWLVSRATLLADQTDPLRLGYLIANGDAVV